MRDQRQFGGSTIENEYWMIAGEPSEDSLSCVNSTNAQGLGALNTMH